MSLQLQHLCGPKMKSEEDIQHELRLLPEKLRDTYSKIYDQISDLSGPSLSIAERALRWLLYSQRQLSSTEFLAAVSVDGSTVTVTEDLILSICSNLVVFDKALKVFRLAHFSVREFLEPHENYSSAKSHAVLAERCLRCFQPGGLSAPGDVLQDYAQQYWALHCQMSADFRRNGNLRPVFETFIGKNESRYTGFDTWSQSGAVYSKLMAWDDPSKPIFESMLSVPSDPIFAACVFDFQEVVGGLRTYNKEKVQARNTRGETVLYLACRYGRQEIVQTLLEVGADSNSKSSNGSTALHVAATHGDDKIMLILVNSGASVDIRDSADQTALHCACESGSIGAAQILIDAKVPVHAKDEYGRTALHCAAQAGDSLMVELLLKSGAKVDGFDNKGRSALHEASERGHDRIVLELLNHGADIETTDTTGWTALARALWKSHEAVIRLLLSYGAKMPMKVGNWMPLHWIAERGNESIAEILLLNGADAKAKDILGKTPLHRAAGAGHLSLFVPLVAEGADVMAKDNSGGTPLSYAAEEGHSNFVELLLDNGVAAGIKDDHGMTPLHHAAGRGHEEVVILLLDRGAAIQEKDQDDKTPLHHAATLGQTGVVRLLLSYGATDTKDHQGKHALHYAAEKGHLDVVVHLHQSIMLSGSGDINAQDYYGMTPCHWAAKEGHQDIMKLLLDKGANPTLTDFEDMTLWDWEVQRQQQQQEGSP